MYKILKILAAILSLAGIIFLVMIIAKGDEAIKQAAKLDGDTSAVDPIAIVAYITLLITVVFVVIFVLKNLFTDTSSLKSTLIGIGLFVGILVIAYAVSGGDTNVYEYNNKPATTMESHMAGAGLIAFYILLAAAAGSMIWAGIKKMTT